MIFLIAQSSQSDHEASHRESREPLPHSSQPARRLLTGGLELVQFHSLKNSGSEVRGERNVRQGEKELIQSCFVVPILLGVSMNEQVRLQARFFIGCERPTPGSLTQAHVFRISHLRTFLKPQ